MFLLRNKKIIFNCTLLSGDLVGVTVFHSHNFICFVVSSIERGADLHMAMLPYLVEN